MREMRNKKREITDMKVIEELLKNARILRLGMVDGNKPYVVPLHYGYTLEDGKLTFFMHGATEGRKIDVLKANDNVFVEIDMDEELIPSDVACDYAAYFLSLMAEGKATLVEDLDEKIRGLKVLMKTQTGRDFDIPEPMAKGTAVIKVDVAEFSAKGRPKQ